MKTVDPLFFNSNLTNFLIFYDSIYMYYSGFVLEKYRTMPKRVTAAKTNWNLSLEKKFSKKRYIYLDFLLTGIVCQYKKSYSRYYQDILLQKCRLFMERYIKRKVAVTFRLRLFSISGYNIQLKVNYSTIITSNMLGA